MLYDRFFRALVSWVETYGMYSMDLENRCDGVSGVARFRDSTHLKRVCVLIECGPREYPVFELRVLSRVQNCLRSSL